MNVIRKRRSEIMNRLAEAIENAVRGCKEYGAGHADAGNDLEVSTQWEVCELNDEWEVISINIYQSGVLKLSYQDIATQVTK